MTVKQLERAAIRAHRADHAWATFWANHAEQVRQCEPYHRGRYHRLVHHLLHLVCSGDPGGEMPAGEPWLDDDVPAVAQPSDTETAARINWEAAGIANDFLGSSLT
jgi:hypothetical protein